MILLRTQEIDNRLEAFAQTLEALSGQMVVYLVDERKGPVEAGARGKVSLTRERCAALGLYCPSDFAWRCGDYGFYLAREQFVDVTHFWMIESDVRIAGRNPRAFFEKFSFADHDLLCGHLDEAGKDWTWRKAARSRDAQAHMCFFPVVRLSANAIDVLLAKRRAHSRRWSRRALWPNDEVFVGTTLFAAGCRLADLNAGSPAVYEAEEFTFAAVRDGDVPLDIEREVALLHPVLFGTALERKLQRLREREPALGALSRLHRKLHRRIGPTAWALAINRRSAW